MCKASCSRIFSAQRHSVSALDAKTRSRAGSQPTHPDVTLRVGRKPIVGGSSHVYKKTTVASYRDHRHPVVSERGCSRGDNAAISVRQRRTRIPRGPLPRPTRQSVVPRSKGSCCKSAPNCGSQGPLRSTLETVPLHHCAGVRNRGAKQQRTTSDAERPARSMASVSATPVTACLTRVSECGPAVLQSAAAAVR